MSGQIRVVTAKPKYSVEFNNAMNLLKDIEDGIKMSKDIAKEYGLHPTTISHIKRRKIWGRMWKNYDQMNAATTIEKAQ